MWEHWHAEYRDEYRGESQIYWEIQVLKKGIFLTGISSSAFPFSLERRANTWNSTGAAVWIRCAEAAHLPDTKKVF